jgi:type II secretory pathway pseudopilin PulG
MMIANAKSPQRNPESGYTLLIALLIVATILLITAAAAPNIYVEGRRDRDEEMIWRGQQYVRAISLYYKKYGRYPQTIDDLTKSDNQIRFLRQAYKDPMNTEDGTWRLIYIGPGGVLINSVMYTNIAQVGLPMGATPPAGMSAGDEGGSDGAATSGTAGASTTSLDDGSQPTPNLTDVIGGNLIGVGSKVKKPSIKVYNGGTTYYQWEFIWKPVQTQQIGAAPAPAPSAPPSGTGPYGNVPVQLNSMPAETPAPPSDSQPSPAPGP